MDADKERQKQHEAELRLSRALWTDPETAPEMQKLVEKVAPGSIARAETQETVRNTVSPLLDEVRKERAAFAKELETEKEQRARQSAIQAVIAKGLASEDEIPEIEKLMREKYVADYEVAATYFRTTRDVAEPRAASVGMQIPGLLGAGGDFFSPKDGPKLGSRDANERDLWARNRAMKDLADLRAGRPLDPAPWDAGLTRY